MSRILLSTDHYENIELFQLVQISKSVKINNLSILLHVSGPVDSFAIVITHISASTFKLRYFLK